MLLGEWIQWDGRWRLEKMFEMDVYGKRLGRKEKIEAVGEKKLLSVDFFLGASQSSCGARPLSMRDALALRHHISRKRDFDFESFNPFSPPQLNDSLRLVLPSQSLYLELYHPESTSTSNNANPRVRGIPCEEAKGSADLRWS
jgi:hypothetical protein